MRILVLGDVMALSGRKAIKKNLSQIIKKYQIDFSVINGENAADDGKGITKEIAEEFFSLGVDVITSGNHIWDKEETTKYIDEENRLLRPANLVETSPGKGFGIYFSKDKKFKIGVVNLMGNVFMKKSSDVFEASKNFLEKNLLKRDYDVLIVDFHGEITSEKMAIGNYFDGQASLVVGTHTHVPTNDARILKKGTGYLTDAGMCGDYDSVIGMNKENSINKFLKQSSLKHQPSTGIATISGVIINIDLNTGLANEIQSLIYGGELKNSHI